MTVLLLVSCASVPQDEARSIHLDVSNCDPRERMDCYSISKETFRAMAESFEESNKLRAAWKFCRERI